MWKWLRRGLVGLLAVAVVATGGLYLWLRTSLPLTQGMIELAGPKTAVKIVRDADGIPTIHARSEADAYFALGYVHAQDRLWQMDFNRRIGSGRLAELLGERALGIDRFMRTMGIGWLAQRQFALLAPETRAALTSYSAGINGFLDNHEGAWPPEFVLLRTRPEPWKPADSLIWSRMMALRLAYNWRTEALRASLSARLSPSQIGQMWPDHGAAHPVTLARQVSPAISRAARALIETMPDDMRPITASNGWVVAGRHSAAGKPILANDPHLPFRAPVLWYLARIEAPGMRLAGATVPGMPFTLLGHTDRFAWGFTSASGDTQDLFIERLDPADPGRYLTPEGSSRFSLRRETIRVRDGDDVTIELRATRHGPVMTENSGAAPKTVMALATPALDPADRSPDAFYALNHAGDWDGFRNALGRLSAPHLNVFYADGGGNIGFVSAGRIPIRRKGDGKTPVPGWSGEYDWTGFIAFDALPQSHNPQSGRIVNANNRIAPDDYPYEMGRARAPGYRARRIRALLGTSRSAGPGDMAAMQLDAVSVMARDLLPVMLRHGTGTEAAGGDMARRVMDMLRRWDGTMARDMPEPLIFTAWLGELNRQLYADELGPDFGAFRGLRPEFVRAILTRYPDWCDDVSTDRKEDCGERIVRARDIALQSLSRRFGDDPARWRWGEAHRAYFRHQLLGRVPLLRQLSDIAIAADGGDFTVNRGRSRSGHPERPFAAIHGAGLRAVYDLADLGATRFMIATGQSGNPLSPHYSDLTRRWRDGGHVPNGGGGETRTLRLVPAR